MHALSVSGLHKSYGSFDVIKDLNLQIERGSIQGLVGLNGSGKTTTIECILGLQSFNAGDIKVLGHEPANLHSAKGKLVAIFDSASLHPNLTVRQCLKQASLLCENPVRTAAEVEQLLSIDRFSNFKIKHLSLGNKRRASIAHALLGQPELIVLDEPFNGLDAEGVDDVLKLITTLNKEEGTAFLLSSHQLPYLEQVCSHIAILHQGGIAVCDKVSNLLAETNNVVLLKTDHREQAIALIEQTEKIKLIKQDEADYLHIAIDEMDSAMLNRLLVEKQIPVAEIILRKASLAKLFREITNEAST